MRGKNCDGNRNGNEGERFLGALGRTPVVALEIDAFGNQLVDGGCVRLATIAEPKVIVANCKDGHGTF